MPSRAGTDRLRQSTAAARQQPAAEEAARQKAPVATVASRSPPARVPLQQQPAVLPVLSPTAAPQLMTARQWLAGGRPDEARRVLAMVQTQMVLQPVTPERPAAEGGNVSATDVGNAIRWLDMGANTQAMQAIDRAIGSTGGSARAAGWSGYPTGQQTNFSNGLSR